MEKSKLKTSHSTESLVIDKESGEVLGSETNRITYMTKDKETFLLMYSSLIAVFTNMEQSEIRVYGYLLQYGNGLKFDVSKSMRKEIATVTSLNERTIYNTLRVLVEKKLIFKHESGLYQLNPRYAYQGSTTDRAVALKTIITLGYEC